MILRDIPRSRGIPEIRICHWISTIGLWQHLEPLLPLVLRLSTTKGRR